MTEYEQKLKTQCMLAAAIGDVLGKNFEFKHSDQIRLDYIENPQLITKNYKTYTDIPVGYISDDFSQILCVEECLNNPRLDFNEELIKWSSGLYWTDNRLYDCGLQTQSALLYYSRTGKIKPSGNKSGNGALMRMLPISFLPYDNIKDSSKKYSELTHNSKESLLCSEFYTKLVHKLWKEKSKPNGKCNVEFFQDIWIELEDEMNWIIPFKLGSASGYCVDSINLAYGCILRSESFNEAITHCIQHGNDTDTNSSILGPLAALVFDMDDVNPRWVDMVKINKSNPYFAKMFDKII